MSRCSACRTHQYPQDNPTDGFMCRIIRTICKTNFHGFYTASKAACRTQTIQKWWWWWWWTPSLRYKRGNQLLVVHRTPITRPPWWASAPFSRPFILRLSLSCLVPQGSPSCGGSVADYVFDINQLSLPTPFYSALVSVSVFMILSTLFHSINSPNKYPLSHFVIPVLFLPYWSFQLFITLWKSP